MSAFRAGDVAIALQSVQGLVKNERYVIEEVIHGQFGVVYYAVRHEQGTETHVVANAHVIMRGAQ